jgi:hypothetical protein
MSYFTLQQEVVLKKLVDREVTMHLSVPRPDQIAERVEENRAAFETYRINALANATNSLPTDEEIYREWMLEKLSRLQLLVEIMFR